MPPDPKSAVGLPPATVRGASSWSWACEGPAMGAWIVSTTDAGFSLEIDYSVGDPVLIQVPPLSVHSDADRDVVEGMASPYATVLVEAIVDSTEPVTKTVAAGPSGRFLVDFSGELDLEPPVSAGTATYSDDMGNQFSRGWSPPALTVWMGNSCMLSAAPTGLAGTSELRAARG